MEVLTLTETAIVDMAKDALLLPAETVTVAGTVAAPIELFSAMVNPPAGAGPFIATVPVAPPPPLTVVGLMEIDSSDGASTATLIAFVAPPSEAETVQP